MHSSQFHYFIDDGLYASQENLLAEAVYRLCARICFAPPGFALVKQSGVHTSAQQRRAIINLKEHLSKIHESRCGQSLGWVALRREKAGQGERAKLHRAEAPSQSILLIGLEPSRLPQSFLLGDYAACASELGLTPVQFLEEFAPVFKRFMHIMAPYTMAVSDLEPGQYHLLAINNSDSPLNKDKGLWQGLLHAFTEPLAALNFTCIEPLSPGAVEAVSRDEIANFLESDPLQS